MKRCLTLAVLTGLVLTLSASEGWSRGFGGGRMGGGFGGGGGRFGGGGGFGGGGFGGGSRFGGGGGFGGGDRFDGGGGGGFGGGQRFGGGGGGGFGGNLGGGDRFGGGAGDFGGGGGRFGGGSDGGFDRGNLGSGNLGGGGRFGGAGAGGAGLGGDRFGGNGAGAGGRFSQDGFGDRFSGSAPARSQLNSFLGLPSDSGLHSMSNANVNNVTRNTDINRNTNVNTGNLGNNFDVNTKTYTGPRGGEAAGASITGPQGNTRYVGGAVGPNGGVAAGTGVKGAGGAEAGRAVVAGPNGRVAAGGAVRGPNGGFAARGAVAGPRGYAAGFVAVSPSGRYAAAAGVRGNFYHWNYYGAGWYARYPNAWRAAAWGVGTAWAICTWDSLGSWFGYGATQPVYYDYGSNVTYQDNSVYVNGQDAGTAEQYYDQAENLAQTGTDADASTDGDWLPLGVFALCKQGQTSSNLVLQLAVNKQGIIRGNYTDSTSNKTQLVHGSVDKQTQRVAFTVGDDQKTVFETGLYNLTKDEAPCLVHDGADSTEQWLLVRLKQDQQQQQDQQASQQQ